MAGAAAELYQPRFEQALKLRPAFAPISRVPASLSYSALVGEPNAQASAQGQQAMGPLPPPQWPGTLVSMPLWQEVHESDAGRGDHSSNETNRRQSGAAVDGRLGLWSDVEDRAELLGADLRRSRRDGSDYWRGDGDHEAGLTAVDSDGDGLHGNWGLEVEEEPELAMDMDGYRRRGFYHGDDGLRPKRAAGQRLGRREQHGEVSGRIMGVGPMECRDDCIDPLDSWSTMGPRALLRSFGAWSAAGPRAGGQAAAASSQAQTLFPPPLLHLRREGGGGGNSDETDGASNAGGGCGGDGGDDRAGQVTGDPTAASQGHFKTGHSSAEPHFYYSPPPLPTVVMGAELTLPGLPPEAHQEHSAGSQAASGNRDSSSRRRSRRENAGETVDRMLHELLKVRLDGEPCGADRAPGAILRLEPAHAPGIRSDAPPPRAALLGFASARLSRVTACALALARPRFMKVGWHSSAGRRAGDGRSAARREPTAAWVTPEAHCSQDHGVLLLQVDFTAEGDVSALNAYRLVAASCWSSILTIKYCYCIVFNQLELH